MMQDLQEALSSRAAHVVVIGLGYVGLPVAASIANAGYRVTGLDVNADRVAVISRGQCPIGGAEPGLAELLERVVASGALDATTDYGVCRSADVILIAVETPVESATRKPRYTALVAVLESMTMHAPERALVIVESTIAPGTMQRIVEPALRATPGQWLLVHCPERLTPGRLLQNIREMPRVVGGMTPEATQLAASFYQTFVQAPLDLVDALTAETVKTAENAYRDVQIAFANELALVCEDLGADAWQVRELVNRVPGRQVHYPGPGVGGHCIPKDPWLLLTHLSERVEPHLIPAARLVNDSMPEHVARLVKKALGDLGQSIAGSIIAVLGYAYREESDDTRNTPSAPLVEHLEREGASVRVHDPYVAGLQSPLGEVLGGADCAVIMLGHLAYREAPWQDLLESMRRPLLIDCRNVLSGGFSGARVIRLGDGSGRRIAPC